MQNAACVHKLLLIDKCKTIFHNNNIDFFHVEEESTIKFSWLIESTSNNHETTTFQTFCTDTQIFENVK